MRMRREERGIWDGRYSARTERFAEAILRLVEFQRAKLEIVLFFYFF